ncbi:MAG: hydantoinase B/oxoprolinase family protein, partial [Chloroflexota bacterium]
MGSKAVSNSGQVDPVTLEVISSAFISISKEMGAVMVKTAYSPIFSEGRDFSTALFDPSLEMIAQGVGCPA